MCKCTAHNVNCDDCLENEANMNSKPMFAVGDKVYSLAHGPGEIKSFVPSKEYKSIYVKFQGTWDCYWPDGRYYSKGDQVLFHDKPTVIPAKKKVKKWIFCWYDGYTSGISFLHQTTEQINVWLKADPKNRAVILPWTEIEVEE